MGTKTIRVTDAQLALLEQVVSQASRNAASFAADAVEFAALLATLKGRKAPRKVTPAVDANLTQGIQDALRQCTSRVSARVVLRTLKVADLRQVTRALGAGACSKLRKDELIEYVIDITVQFRLDHNAIMSSRNS